MIGLTRKAAADLAGVSEATIRNWLRRGLLRPSRATRRQRITAQDVQDALQRVHAGNVVPRWQADPIRAGQRLRALREAAGLTQKELARRSGLSPDGLSYMELGKRPPLALTITKLSQVLGIAPSQFVDDSPLGLQGLSTEEAGQRLGVAHARVRVWVQAGVLPGSKLGGQWRIPAVAVEELGRSGRLRGRSRRLDG